MNTVPASRYPVLRSAGWGASGFGIGLALAGLITGALIFQIHDFDTGLWLSTALYAGAGALGGAALSWGSGSKRRAPLMALAGAVSLGLGLSVTRVIVSVWFDEPSSLVHGYLAWQVVSTIQYAAIGALTGALLGLVQQDWRRTAWLVLAGTLGFGVFYLPYFASLSFIIDPIIRMLPGANGDFTQQSVVSAVAGFVWGAIEGGIAGACLGIGSALRPRAGRLQHGLTSLLGILRR